MNCEGCYKNNLCWYCAKYFGCSLLKKEKGCFLCDKEGCPRVEKKGKSHEQ